MKRKYVNFPLWLFDILPIISIFVVGNSAKELNLRFMVNQKMISFKINDDLLSGLDALCEEYDIKRNKMLNILVSIGISNMAGKRSLFELVGIYSNMVF